MITSLDLIDKFKANINEYALVEKNDKILLGVSGGPDSLTMLDLFYRLRGEYKLEITVFHLDHCFRSEAREEAEFVKKICQKMNLQIVVKSFPVPSYAEEKNFTPEEAARRVRLDFMKKIIKQYSLHKISLGHNRDDLVETVLFNLFRGSGLRGLQGIEPQSEVEGVEIIHPLLFFSRQEIEAYCEFRGLNPIQDPTNKQSVYTRNIIRNEIIPLVEKKINPEVKEAIFRTSGLIREVDESLTEKEINKKEQVISNEKKDRIELDVEKLKSLPSWLRRRIVRNVIACLKGHPDNIYFEHYQLLDKLIFELETGKKIDLKGDIGVKKIYDKLIVFRGEDREAIDKYCFDLPVPGEIELPGNKIIRATLVNIKACSQEELTKKELCFCDAGEVEFPLQVRNRKTGDKIQPLGMTGTKKVKDIFIDEKIVPLQRELIPLVVDARGRIVWLTGLKMDEKFKITDKTNKVLRLEIINQ